MREQSSVKGASWTSASSPRRFGMLTVPSRIEGQARGLSLPMAVEPRAGAGWVRKVTFSVSC